MTETITDDFSLLPFQIVVIVTEFFAVGVDYEEPTITLVTCQDNMVKAEVAN